VSLERAEGKRGGPIRFDLFELDARGSELRRSGMVVELPPQALKVLGILADRPDELVTRKEMQEALWPGQAYGDFDGRLNFAVRKLREALGDDAEQPRYVQTVRNAGYRFIAPVRERNPTTDSVDSPPKARAWPWKSWLLFAAVCGLVVAAWLLWRGAYGGPVARADFSDDMLVARNKRGSILWAKPFDEPLDPRPELRAGRIAIVDLGQDRRNDILVAAPFSAPDPSKSANDTLYCFSSQGKLRWHHIFDGSFRFGDHDYGSPWGADPPVVISDGARLSIWAAAYETYWSPSTLTEFDADGHQLAEFVNWGHIMVVNHVRNASGSYILAGGISNQCDCAMLAVLNEE
jgi:DNA-binding winged helix-turn-helix (wHTH) protein